MSCPSFAARSSAALRAVSLTLVLAAVACDDAATPVSPAASPDRALAGKGVVRSEWFHRLHEQPRRGQLDPCDEARGERGHEAHRRRVGPGAERNRKIAFARGVDGWSQ